MSEAETPVVEQTSRSLATFARTYAPVAIGAVVGALASRKLSALKVNAEAPTPKS